MCKKRLQLLPPDPQPGLRPWTPLEDSRPQAPAPLQKNPAGALDSDRPIFIKLGKMIETSKRIHPVSFDIVLVLISLDLFPDPDRNHEPCVVAARYYAQARPLASCSVCVRPSVTYSVKIIVISSTFFQPLGSHILIIFPHQILWQYFDGDPLMGRRMQDIMKNRDLRPISPLYLGNDTR